MMWEPEDARKPRAPASVARVVPLAPQHVAEVAALHCEVLTGLVADLGPRVARVVYRSYVKSGGVLGLVILEEGHVRAFAVGSAAPQRLRRSTLRGDFLALAWSVLVGLVRHPSAVRAVAGALVGGSDAFDRTAAELTYLAVAEDRSGAGLATRLVQEFERAMRERGVRSYELSVAVDNERAIAFYEAHGFSRIASYREFGTPYHRYRKSLR